MKRDLQALADRPFDLVIVGGGVFGACTAWDATRRGLSVALIERADFGSAASANCFKIAHGGMRYLQHADFVRVRESARERSALLRIAPHLVTPLPIAVPTYGHGMKSRELMWAAMGIYDAATCDRNRGIPDSERHVPRSYFLGRDELLRQFPGLQTSRLTGAAVFHDGQIYSPPRLVLAFVRSAAVAGAAVANYVEATGFLIRGRRIEGVRVRDRLGGTEFEIRGRLVINAAGAWAEPLLRSGAGLALSPPSTFSRDACFVIKRRFAGPLTLAVPGQTRDPDALLSRETRHLFLQPWREYTLVGVWHAVYRDPPDTLTLTEDDLKSFIAEVNAGYPALELALGDVSLWNTGLVLFGENQPGSVHLSYGKRSRLVDHARFGVEGLMTLIGVRFTTARLEAQRAVDMALRKLGLRAGPADTARVPLYGGDFDSFAALLRDAERRYGQAVPPSALRALLHNHGSRHGDVLAVGARDPRVLHPVGDTPTLAAEVVYAVREEMAVRLGDVLFRRTDLATGGHPGETALEQAAGIMGAELGWDAAQTAGELESVRAFLAERCFNLAQSRTAGHAPNRRAENK